MRITSADSSPSESLSALIEVSEAAQKRPAETPNMTPPRWGETRAAAATQTAPIASRPTHAARVPASDSEYAASPPPSSVAARNASPSAAMPTPIHSRRVTSCAKRRSAVTVSRTRPPAITDCTSEIGARESAADVKAPGRRRDEDPERVRAGAEQPQRGPHRVAQAHRRRLHRAAVLVEEADDRGERGRDGEQQADLDREAHGEARLAGGGARGVKTRCPAAGRQATVGGGS